MKTNNIKIKTRRFAGFLFSLFTLFFFATAPVFAGKTVTYEGTIQGATCVHYQKMCPLNHQDAHIAGERDFVLSLPGKTHYYLPNLDRSIKARYVGKSVRITGESGEHEIWVTRLELKDDRGFRTIWTLEEQEKMYNNSGG